MLVYYVLLFMLQAVVGFLLDTPCEASSPCSCLNDHNRQHIHCEASGLTSIPAFHNTTSTANDMYLDLSGNDLSTVRTYAFKNLNHSRLNSFYLYLENNQISTIQKDAFMGVTQPMRELYLANNKLSTIPSAFANLTNLQKLDIRNNSITTYDSHTMGILGRNLRYLSIGSANMIQWPDELHYLRYLISLDIFYVGMQSLPQDAFHGFETTLQTLRIDSTSIGVLNPAICHLTNLKTFYFDNNNYYHGHRSIFEPCQTPLSSLQTLHISNDDLQDFPPVLAVFPGLTTLFIINNPMLYFMDDTLIPASTKLENLYLNSNGFTRVPEAVQKMQLLQKLDLHDNVIRLVETHDLTDMDALTTIRLDGNPIEYISTTAFQNLPQLRNLLLNATSITEFPPSITSLATLHYVLLPNDQIECICDTLGYLKTWNVQRGLNIEGFCEASGERIFDYIRGYVSRYCKN